MKKLVILIALILFINSVFVLAVVSTEPSAGGSGGGGVAYPVPAPTGNGGGGGCADSDYGFDYYTKGTVKYTSGTNYTDYCKDDKTLIEYSCGRTECKTVEICPELVEPVLPAPRIYVTYHTESINTFIDGQVQTETIGGFSQGIAEGTHVFLFKKQGYKDCEKKIDFKQGYLITVDVTLQPLNSTQECILSVAGSSGGGGGGRACYGKTECNTVDKSRAYFCPNKCEDGACVVKECTNGTSEGETSMPNEINCCGGLSAYGNYKIDSAGNCIQVEEYGKQLVCINCGNGICGPGENKCNCPRDCINVVKESVKCVFINSKTEQKCYSDPTLIKQLRTCSGIESCIVYVEGYFGEKITWKSTCGGYAYTIVDGTDDYVKFDCLEVPPEPKPVCGNGICEPGEGEVCYVNLPFCKVGEPCEAEEQCKVVCPADCGVVPERPVRLNEKFKLQLKESVSVIDYKDMKIKFLDIYQARCAVREIYQEAKAIVATTGSVVESPIETPTQAEEMYPTKVAEVTESEEKGRAMDIDSGQITRCVGGEIIARLAVTIEEEPTKYVSIQLGERKPVFRVTLSFLDYYSKYNTGVFLVSKKVIDCPVGCICSADGTIGCPQKPECVPGTILCPDGICRKECGITTECKFACMYGESCLPIGTRVEGKYCTIDRNLENQLESEESCENNFECKSNVCVDGQCISGSLLRRILSWFKKLFS